jgi:translation initiation factor IF-2
MISQCSSRSSIIFQLIKVDKPNANPEKIKEKLAGMNLLVEDWGGKQS